MRFFLALAALASSSLAHAQPLIVHNGRLFIPATIGEIQTEALLDSGAEATIVDPVLAKRANLPEGQATEMKGSGGKAPARIVPDVTVQTLGITLRPEAVVVMDLTELSSRLIKRPTQAIVGRELFDAARLRIDLAGGRIDILAPDSTPPGARLPLTPHAGIEAIPVTVNGITADAEFDLGNGSDVMVSRAMSTRLGLKTVGKKAGGGIGGEIIRDKVVLKSLEVGGRTFRDVPAVIDELPNANDLNIGTSILSSFLITTDFKGRAVWLEPKIGAK